MYDLIKITGVKNGWFSYLLKSRIPELKPNIFTIFTTNTGSDIRACETTWVELLHLVANGEITIDVNPTSMNCK